jgi:hypothetical protein
MLSIHLRLGLPSGLFPSGYLTDLANKNLIAFIQHSKTILSYQLPILRSWAWQ